MTDTPAHMDRGIAASYKAVRAEIDRICRACGRDPSGVTLVSVSKNAEASDAVEAARAGALDLGENRVQELLDKQRYFEESGLRPNWHLIGTLQTRKVRQVVGKTHLIHSLDRITLAREIDRRSTVAGIRTDALLQVNIAREESKHGFDPDDVDAALNEIRGMSGLRVLGLMAMAPLQGGRSVAQETFDEVRALFDRLQQEGRVDSSLFNMLSMGMSGDYEEAIRAGATHVRIGTAIFGHKPV